MNIWKKTLYKGHSPVNGEVMVTEYMGIRRLVAGGHTQSQSLNSNGITGYRYWDDMVPPELRLTLDARVLIIGLGAGTTVKIINHRFGPVAIDGVEIDPLMIELGKKYFDMNEPNLQVHLTDAVDYVRDARYKYDLICLDAFVAGSVPEKIQTGDFLTSVKNILTPEGLCSMNKIFSGKEELEEFEKLVNSVFPNVSSHVVRGDPRLDNVIVYARG